MPVDVTCGSCQRKMRVPDTAAGKRIKCPKCQAIIDVPGPASAVPMGVAVEMWHLKTDDGQTYGPVSRADLDLWQAEGRLNNDSQVLRVGADQWQWATDLYPKLAAAPASAVPMGVAASPYDSAASAATGPAPHVAPANPFDFTSGAAQTSAPANPFDFSAGGSSAGRTSSTSSSTVKVSDKSKIVAGLLGIFLGAYGIHNFSLGFTSKAITQLILIIPTCGLSGIWGFVEGIMILTGSMNRDARGRRLKD